MTDDRAIPEAETTHVRAGIAYAVLTAALAAVLLFLPLLLLGITMSVVASVVRGDIVAWRGSVDMTYVFIGVPALLSLLLLIIPFALFRAAGRRLGTRPAIRWAGGLLVAWNAGMALVWASAAMSRATPILERDEFWYAAAFGIGAVVILVGTVVAEKQAAGAAVSFIGVLAVGIVALGVVLVAVWGSPPRIRPDAQTVHMVVTASNVRLDPATVQAGEVYFVLQAPDDPDQHADFSFVSAGYGQQCCADPLPLSDDQLGRLAHGDYQGTAAEGGWGTYAKLTLSDGNYAFLTLGPEGDQPGTPPHSIAVLEVLP